MNTAHSGRWAALLAVLALAACQPASRTNSTPAQPAATATSTTAPTMRPSALFYTKSGSLYVSEPAGAPGRKLTDGPADAQPAPSPDLAHVAFVRKTTASDYGGELWVLDLSPQLTPVAPPRRLVDPAQVNPSSSGNTRLVGSPRWSPTGGRIAFLETTPTPAGSLLTAAADTGAVLIPEQPVWADNHYAWAPDGRHIASITGRSDVRPATVNVWTVGGASTPVASGTNASSVTYGDSGSAIIFSNTDTTDPVMFPKNPFALRTGGVYSVPALTEAGATPPALTTLFTRTGSYYGDIAALDSGAVAFTTHTMTRGGASSPKTIQILDKGSSVPRTVVTDLADSFICQDVPGGGKVCRDPQGPVWGSGDVVAYLNNDPESALVVTDPDNRSPMRIDTGVDTFAWAPWSR